MRNTPFIPIAAAVVMAALFAAPRAVAQDAYGYSSIWLIGSTVYSSSTTTVDYGASYYYTPEAYGYLWYNSWTQNISGYQAAASTVSVSLSYPATFGQTYDIQTNHWLAGSDHYGYARVPPATGPTGYIMVTPPGSGSGATGSYFIGSTYESVTDNNAPPSITSTETSGYGTLQAGTNGYIILQGSGLGSASVSASGGVSVSVSANTSSQVNVYYSIPANESATTHTLYLSTPYGSSSTTFPVYPPAPQPPIISSMQSTSGNSTMGTSGTAAIYGYHLTGATVSIASVQVTSILYNSDGQVNFSYTIPITSHVGNHSLTLSTAVSPAATYNFPVYIGSQSITFNSPGNRVYGAAPFGLSATASSGLAVSFSSGTTGVCTVSGSTVTIVAAGGCTITANQSGNSDWSAAASVPQSFTVAKASQTITFNAPGNVAYGVPPFGLSATASSGLAVSFSSGTTSVCTVSGATVTIVAVGTCTITASQGGNANWNAATNVSQSFSAGKASQTITFNAPGNVGYGAPPFGLSATASSGLPVSYVSNTTGVCTVSGATVTIVAAGTCTITANQSGNANWNAATSVQRSFSVTNGSQTITFNQPANVVYGAAPFGLSATASSGLVVSFVSGTTSVCTVSGSTVTIVGVGTCSITASQAGNSNYDAATPVVQSFTVAAAVPACGREFIHLNARTLVIKNSCGGQ